MVLTTSKGKTVDSQYTLQDALIDAMGQWTPSRASNGNVERLLGLLAQDPVGTMQAYGHSTGQYPF